MNKNILLISTVILVAGIIIWIAFQYISNNNGLLVNPWIKKTTNQLATPVPSMLFNPPKEIKYDSSTNLEEELEKVNPEVLDSDFE